MSTTSPERPVRPQVPPSIFSPGLRSTSLGAAALISLFALEYIAVGAAMPTVAADLNGYHLYNMAFGATVAAGYEGDGPALLTTAGQVIGAEWTHPNQITADQAQKVLAAVREDNNEEN